MLLPRTIYGASGAPNNAKTGVPMVRGTEGLLVPEDIHGQNSRGGASGNQRGYCADDNGGTGDPQCVRRIRMEWNVRNRIDFRVQVDQAIGAGNPCGAVTENKSHERANGAD